MKWIIPVLIFLLSSCAAPTGSISDSVRANPQVIATFKKPLPKKLHIMPPIPLAHSEPETVLRPRINQMEGAVRMALEKKGYSFESSPFSGAVTAMIDYQTSPSPFVQGTWTHKVDIKFWGDGMKTYYGWTTALWNDFPSESIDSILLGLMLQALERVPMAGQLPLTEDR